MAVYWFDDEIDGMTVRHVLATHKTDPDLLDGTIRGRYLPEDKLIAIDASEHEEIQDETCWHEHMHAARFPKGVTAAQEEAIIRKQSPRIYATARRYGFRWPPRPEGYRKALGIDS